MITKTAIGNYLRKQPNGDVGMYRYGFKDGVAWAMRRLTTPKPAQDFQEWWNSLPCEPSYQDAFAAGKSAAPAPQPAQDPVKFLANGTRFKVNFDGDGGVYCFAGHEKELQGRWVALVAAEDNCHLQSAQPVAQKERPDFMAGYDAGMDDAKRMAQPDHIPDAGKMVQPVAQPNIQKYHEKDNRLSDDEILSIAHRTATRHTHFVQPGQVMYGFAQHHMIDLVRAIEKAHGIGEVK